MPTIAAKGEIRDGILDATEHLLARYGYRKMTVEDIAHEVGVGRAQSISILRAKKRVVLTMSTELLTA